MSSGTLGGTAITAARVQVPAWGVWWADVEVAEEVSLTGRQSMTLGGVAFSGTIISGGVVLGRSRYRIAGGAGGWGTTLPAQAYANDAGVKKSTVLGDAANACGESLSGASIDRVGPHFVRSEGPASNVLNLLEPKNWYVDFAGLTQIGQRASSIYSGEATPVRIDPARGIIELAVDSLTGLAPGVLYGDNDPALDIEYNLTSERLTATLWTGGSFGAGRRASALKAIIDALLPDLLYRGTYEYRIVSSGDRLDLQPVRVAGGLPVLQKVPIRPGVAGVKTSLQPGSLVLVTFVDADPGRPAVVAFDAVDNPGWSPLSMDVGGDLTTTMKLGGPVTSVQVGQAGPVKLGSAAALGVAYMGGTVQAGPFSGVITLGSSLVTTSI